MRRFERPSGTKHSLYLQRHCYLLVFTISLDCWGQKSCRSILKSFKPVFRLMQVDCFGSYRSRFGCGKNGFGRNLVEDCSASSGGQVLPFASVGSLALFAVCSASSEEIWLTCFHMRGPPPILYGLFLRWARILNPLGLRNWRVIKIHHHILRTTC